MRRKEYRWFVAPGFSVVRAMTAFTEGGVMALERKEISVIPRKGWKEVRIVVTVERPLIASVDTGNAHRG
jgi:hypothetical protein